LEASFSEYLHRQEPVLVLNFGPQTQENCQHSDKLHMNEAIEDFLTPCFGSVMGSLVASMNLGRVTEAEVGAKRLNLKFQLNLDAGVV
jgi:hypothetical protein